MNSSLRIVIILFLMTIYLCGNFNNSLAQEYSDNEFEAEFLEDFENFGNNSEKTDNTDPLEPINRKIFVFNETFDKYFFEHVARTYRLAIPKKAKISIRNFLNNLSKPVSLINSVAQGKVDNSLATLSSFLINSTVGVFGLFDVADSNGISYEQEDLGQTMGYYGIGSGIYLVIPFKGPSSLRDFSGWVADLTISPTGFNALRFGQKPNFLDDEYNIGSGLLSAVDARESLLNTIEEIRKDSFDPYVTIRSAYTQNRLAKIKK